ncbi:MAG: glycogen/starch/alpha-glucan phosphorylase [Vicinamibacterales bacterium]
MSPRPDSVAPAPPPADRASLRQAIVERLQTSLGKSPATATDRDWLAAASLTVRDHLIHRWMATMAGCYAAGGKRVYYLSLEFLTGRLLANALMNLGLYEPFRDALSDLEQSYDALKEVEPDAALGNGGLGRLAACLLDSMATHALPGYGYGLRYEYGLFYQRIEDGAQVEQPDPWLRFGNPWELQRPEVFYPVKFGGRVQEYADPQGRLRHDWVDAEEVMALASDTPVPGYGTDTVNHLRLWSARSSRDFDLKYFNEGNYIKAVEAKTASENLSKVLYPDDTTSQGRELRFKQQYLLVSASLQDILRRFVTEHGDLAALDRHVAIQLNDTHPSIAVAELMRLLVDRYGMGWDGAWAVTRRTFSYTNHTLMPEALETWPVELVGRLLPRHLAVVYEINRRFLDEVRRRAPGDEGRVRRLSLIGEDGVRHVRMAHLAMVGSHTVNGVSRLHTALMRDTIFADFHWLWPDQIVAITNGVTPRRWLHHANRDLATLITGAIGDGWVRDLGELSRLAPLAGDPAFRAEFRRVKRANKVRLADLVARNLGVTVDPDALLAVQVKRIHEYKRQLLNVLYVVARYARILEGRTSGLAPRTVLISGKAAPGYRAAKQIIRLVHGVADVVNRDPAARGLLTVVFYPNYSVSNAERIIPACDLSEQISTAGTEASGTGNMKLALNGALTIGTLDGATVEMREAVGAEHFFTFGLTAAEVTAWRQAGYRPGEVLQGQPELRHALDLVARGVFSPGDPSRFHDVCRSLVEGGDPFFVVADFAAYAACQDRVDALWHTPDAWDRAAILNVAGMGAFSSDRMVLDYARQVWGLAGQPRAKAA